MAFEVFPLLEISTQDAYFDAASNSGYQSTGSTYDFNVTVAAGAINRFLSVDVALLSLAGTTVSSIVLDPTGSAQSLSNIGSVASGTGLVRVESWGLVAPVTGTHVCRVTFSGSIGAGASAATAVAYYGVNQTSPTEAYNSATALNVGAADATVTVTSIANRCLIHAACASNDTSITANQIGRNNVTGTLGSGANEDTQFLTPAGAQVMSFTNVGAAQTWAIGGYAVRPVSASSAASYTKTTTDAPTYAESLARTFAGLRTTAAAPVYSDSAARVTSALRTATDAPTDSESVVRVVAGVRSATAAPVFSESAARVVAAVRTDTDALTFSDAATRLQAVARAVAAAPTFADATTRAEVLARAVADAPSSADAATRAFTGTRATAETESTADAAARAATLGRTVTAAPIFSDVVATTSILGRAATGAAVYADTAARAFVGLRTTVEAPTYGDAAVDVPVSPPVVLTGGGGGGGGPILLADLLPKKDARPSEPAAQAAYEEDIAAAILLLLSY